MEEIKVGDTVRLKSGGPVMTVARIVPNPKIQGESIICIWFNKQEERQDGAFSADTLKHAKAS